MPDNQQPISYYVEEAKRLGLSEDQIAVIGDETDGRSFREHIANAHDKTDDELRDILTEEWDNYSADHSGEDAAQGFDSAAQAEDEANGRHADSDEGEDDEDDYDDEPDEDSLDHLEIDEDAIERKRNGGGEALDDGEADCEGCKI